MSELIWRKSSFSGSGGNGNCLEATATPTGLVHFRESDRPGEVLSTTPAHWAAFLRAIKGGEAGQL
ncbi:DUF397 domain-containing protein [Streptomyces sp. So13.3]|uniref:DUF397 domain-containing protein n=1 Tax=Streptomyces TaxID=1883 RepID=UPI0011057D9C|nr:MULTISPECIES: DUF397 domain-containing protein [Streptomyces]MCZ4097028.1 DUF397 domain-containing protein [Streptomyces sp. H39-C1]QNA74731.1 DUF397 domain-containing protein [Streptomyces sp. So13.3]